MEYLFIYLLQITNNVERLTDICLILLTITVALYALAGMISEFDIEEMKKALNGVKKILVTIVSLYFVLFFIPTKQTLLLIGGAYLGKQAVNQVVTSQKLEKINTIIDLQLDKYIKELRGANNDN